MDDGVENGREASQERRETETQELQVAGKKMATGGELKTDVTCR